MGASEPRDQLPQRAGHVREKRLGQPAGRHDAERVAVEPGLVGGDEALLAADAHADGAPFALELAQQPVGVDAGEHALGDLLPASGRRRRRSTSCSPSRPVARVISERCCRSSSTRASAPGSISSRSSSWPSSSRSRSRSSDSAAARRSALGVSPSYM